MVELLERDDFMNDLFQILFGFAPCWAYKRTNAVHADSLGVYTSDKIFNLSTIDKIQLKCDVFDGSVVNEVRTSKFSVLF